MLAFIYSIIHIHLFINKYAEKNLAKRSAAIFNKMLFVVPMTAAAPNIQRNNLSRTMATIPQS
jgi:hypothetical protein